MTIEIHNPELESILEQRLRAGNFASVEEMLNRHVQSDSGDGGQCAKSQSARRCGSHP